MNAAMTPRLNEDEALAPGPITLLRTQLEQRAAEFAMVLPSHITPEKFQRTVLTAVQTNPDLLKADRRSFLTACMKSAQDGCLPDGREAAIVVFNTRMKVDGEWRWVKLAQYMPMVFGLRKKILQSGEIADIYAQVVYRQEIEEGRFHYEEGSERTLRHRPMIAPDFRPTDADIALAYSIATFTSGRQSYEIMRRFEIDEVREMSQTGAQFDAKGDPRDAKGPWVDWFPEMAKKSVIRRHSKTLPQSSDVIITDVEAEDMAFAAKSAVAMLESAKADASRPVLDEGGTFDDEVKDEPRPRPEPEAETETRPARRRRPPAPKPEPEAPSHVDASDNDPPAAEPEHPETDALEPYGVEPTPPDDGDEARRPEPEDGPEDELETDELGVTKTADEKKAEEYIARAQACELLIDFRKLERDAEMDLAEMPVHIAACVDTEFEKARKRLSPRRTK